MNDKPVVCGRCGAAMAERMVAPCLDCGGKPKEVEECLRGEHFYSHIRLLDGELLCDFCSADIPSNNPLFWGFPRDLDWDAALQQDSYEELRDRKPRIEKACSNTKCGNTLRLQEFVVRNARKNNVELPKKFWPHL